jgi:hypothetical protein
MAERLMARAALLALVLAAGCKGKKTEATSTTVFDAPTPITIDAARPAVDAAMPSMPSESMIADGLGPMLLAGPARSGKDVLWCTRGDNGMADWRETICHQVSPGKKPVVTPVMTYADAMVIDEGVDPAGDADAGPRAAGARDRVAAAIAKLGLGAASLTAMPAPVRCSFDGGEFTGRTGEAPADPAAADGCVVDGLTVSLDAQGKLKLVSADKLLLTEVFKARARGKGDGGETCYLLASHVELSVDAAAGVAALAVWLSNPSDTCALVTEFEVRAVAL